MSDEELQLVRGSDNPFRDLGLSDPDTKLMKADLVAGILRILRERDLSGAAAELARVTEADISRIRNANLNRFTIDRLVKIVNHLDRQIEVGVTMRHAARMRSSRAPRIRDSPSAASRTQSALRPAPPPPRPGGGDRLPAPELT